ncbi:hypothetical protein FRC06_002164, partial [Ceratobasidium sp. 370]
MGASGLWEAESEAVSVAESEAASRAEPKTVSGEVTTAVSEAHTRVDDSNMRPRLFYNKEGVYVEPFPDPRAGTPINDMVVSPPDLDTYMAAAGNLGNPFHFDTLELLMMTDLTAGGRDEHLQSHIYTGRTPWETNTAMMDDLDKLPHGPHWSAYKLQSQENERSIRRSYLFTRNIVEVVADVMVKLAFNGLMDFAPERRYTTEDCSNWVYGNTSSARWWWRTQ